MAPILGFVLLLPPSLLAENLAPFDPPSARVMDAHHRVAASVGNLSMAQIQEDPARLMLDFDAPAPFPATGADGANGLLKVRFSDGGPLRREAVVRFNAENFNWWKILNDRSGTSGDQALSLRGIKAGKEKLYLQFSIPMKRVGFTLSQVSGAGPVQIFFYRDADAYELSSNLIIPAGALPEGKALFVGHEDSRGIMRVGFEFSEAAATANRARVLDDLAFAPLPRSGPRPPAENRVYPPEIAAWDENTKERQRQAAFDLMARLAGAIARGETSFRIPPAHYRFGTMEAPHFKLSATNLVIDGSGSTFWFHGRERWDGLLLQSCKNVTVKGLVIDYDPFSYSQGEITAFDAAAKTIDLRIEPGFPRPDGWAKGGGNIKAEFADRNGNFIPVRMDWVKGLSRVSDGVYRAELRMGNIFDYRSEVRIGDRMVLPDRSYRMAVNAADCEAVGFEDLTVYAAPHMALTEGGGEGGNSYRRCRVVRRPGTGRILACNADVFHSIKVKKGPLIEGCEFSWACDDFINIHSFFSVVDAVSGPNEASVVTFFAPDIEVGTTLSFFSRTDMRPLGVANVLRLELETNAAEHARVKRIPAELRALGASVAEFTGSRVWPCKMTLDAPIRAARLDYVLSSDRIARGTVIRSNYFHDTIARGVLVKSEDFVIEGNRIENVGFSGILVASDIYFWEGPFSHRGLIRGNTLSNACMMTDGALWWNGFHAAISIWTAGEGHRFLPEGVWNSRISVVSNRIIDSGASAIFAANTRELRVTDNVALRPFARPLHALADGALRSNAWAIQLVACDRPLVGGNVVRDAGAACLGPFQATNVTGFP